MKTIMNLLFGCFFTLSGLASTTPSTYIHINKSTYLAGESIWFSVYLTDVESKKLWQNTEVVYVQLFNKDGQLVEKSMIQSQSGRGWGKIKTPDYLDSGVYRLRAFTGSLNEEKLITEKWIDIIHPKSPYKFKVNTKENNIESEELFGINVRTEKNEFNKREKVKVHILTKDPSTLSVSVVDLKNFPLDSSQNIFYRYKSSEAKVNYFQSKNGGFMIAGLVKEKGLMNPLKNYDLLLVFKDEISTKSVLTKTDEKGRFSLENIQLFGKASITYQGVNKKGASFPIEIEFESLEPDIKLNQIQYKKEIKEYDYQNFVSYNLTDGEKIDSTTILGEITIKSVKVVPPDPIQSKLYDKPTRMYVTDGKSRGFTNVFDMLSGQLAGVRVSYMFDVYKGVMPVPVVSLCAMCPAPLYVLDGVTLDPESAMDILLTVNPNEIYRVDVLTNTDATIYGTRAAGGVLLFYTKRFSNLQQDYVSNTYEVKGYDYQADFSSPNYSEANDKNKPDVRQSIYWNPEVITNEKGYANVEFYTADLPTNYAIVVEGINEEGKVGRGVKKIIINDNKY